MKNGGNFADTIGALNTFLRYDKEGKKKKKKKKRKNKNGKKEHRKDGGGRLYDVFAIHGQRYAKDATVSSTRGDKVEGRIENRVGRSLTEKRTAA